MSPSLAAAGLLEARRGSWGQLWFPRCSLARKKWDFFSQAAIHILLGWVFQPRWGLQPQEDPGGSLRVSQGHLTGHFKPRPLRSPAQALSLFFSGETLLEDTQTYLGPSSSRDTAASARIGEGSKTH